MTRRTVEDTEGNRYLLIKQSGESSLVRQPETGDRRHIPNEDLTVVEDASTVDTVLESLSEDVLTLVTAVHDDRMLAVLHEIDVEGPIAVRTLLSAYDFCESDLHGILGELTAGGLVRETRVAGERGYETTERASVALDTVRSP
jgi:predicted nucleotidyltransferase